MLSTIIRVQSIQVPRIWELVKFAAVRSQEIAPEIFQSFCIRLLHSLLNGRVQCWIRYDEAGVVLSVQLTQISNNDVTGVKELLVLGTYSFKLVAEEEVLEQYRLWAAFAKSVGCERIVLYSSVPRVWQLAETAGAKPGYRQYVYPVGGE